MDFTKTLAAAAFLAATLAAGSAFAKAHDQGVDSKFQTEEPDDLNADTAPGEDAVEETAAAAQTLGAALGDARGFPRLRGEEPGKGNDEE